MSEQDGDWLKEMLRLQAQIDERTRQRLQSVSDQIPILTEIVALQSQMIVAQTHLLMSISQRLDVLEPGSSGGQGAAHEHGG